MGKWTLEVGQKTFWVHFTLELWQRPVPVASFDAVIAALKSDPHVVKVLKENNCLHIEYKLD